MELPTPTNNCPKCGEETLLIWCHTQDRTEVPLCNKCYEKQKEPAIELEAYKVFLNPICFFRDGTWRVFTRKDFLAMRIFIDDCIDAYYSSRPEDNKFTRNLLAIETLFVDLQATLKSKSLSSANNTFRIKILSRIQGEINAIKARPYKSKKLSWELLKANGDNLEKFIDALKGSRNQKSDWTRLEKICGLNPTEIYRGTNEFDGYTAFYFERNRIALLECQIVGNAIYLIRGDWKDLTKYSKSELLRQYKDRVHRIAHTGEWYTKLTRVLQQTEQHCDLS